MFPSTWACAADRIVDVLVIGAGPAGFAAAVATARRGLRTMLVERHGAAGGAMTMGLNLTPVGFEPFKYWSDPTDPDGFVVQGIARELYDAMVAERAVVKPVWDAETCKWQIDRILTAAGVHVLYHATCAEAWVEEGRVRGAVLATRAGLWRVEAAITIDCSGDGELLSKAGALFDYGREGDARPQPMALVAMVGGIDLDLPAGAPYGAWMQHSRERVAPVLAEACEKGLIPPTFAGILFPRVVRGGILADQAWARWVPRWADPTNPEEVSLAQVQARDILFQIIDFMRANLPGFGNVAVLQTSTEAWPRESRRVRGVRRLEEVDVVENHSSSEGIAIGAGFLELHSASEGDTGAERGYEWKSRFSLIDEDIHYDIPYGCLVPRHIDGLLVAGRCISASHIAQSSVRMQVTCMATGQAAGVAAAMAIDSDIQPRHVDIPQLREALRRDGARV